MDNENLAAYECYFVMNKKFNPYEMLRVHESGDAPYQKNFVLKMSEKYVSSWRRRPTWTWDAIAAS